MKGSGCSLKLVNKAWPRGGERERERERQTGLNTAAGGGRGRGRLQPATTYSHLPVGEEAPVKLLVLVLTQSPCPARLRPSLLNLGRHSWRNKRPCRRAAGEQLLGLYRILSCNYYLSWICIDYSCCLTFSVQNQTRRAWRAGLLCKSRLRNASKEFMAPVRFLQPRSCTVAETRVYWQQGNTRVLLEWLAGHARSRVV